MIRSKELFLSAVLVVLMIYATYASKGHIKQIFSSSGGVANFRNGIEDGSWGLEYYVELAKAIAKGKSHLLQDPPQEMVALSAPYDPQANLHYRFHDASYYKGKYYLYWSPVPVFLFYFPVRAIFGHYPRDAAANFTFYFLAFVLMVVSLKELPNYSSSKIDARNLWLLIFSFGVNANFTYQIAGSSIYTIAVACSTFLTMLFMFGFLKFRNPGNSSWQRIAWMLLMGAGASLAICIRPNLLPGFFVSGILITLLYWKKIRFSAAFFWLSWPVFGGLSAFYNYIRFGSFSEIGINYQLTGVNNPQIEYFGLNPVTTFQKLTFNLGYYFLNAPTLKEYFPYYIARPGDNPPPIMALNTPGFGAVISALPVALLVSYLIRKFIKTENKNLKELVARPLFIPFVFVVVNFGVVLLMSIANIRYITEGIAITWLLFANSFLSDEVQNSKYLPWLSFALVVSVCVGGMIGFTGDWMWAVNRF